MKAAVLNIPLRDWLPKKPDWLDHQTAVGLTFAVKTFAASLLALYIAFWAGLDHPRWSFLTVFVVSQPDSGLVLAKSFYRILGTIAGLLGWCSSDGLPQASPAARQQNRSRSYKSAIAEV